MYVVVLPFYKWRNKGPENLRAHFKGENKTKQNHHTLEAEFRSFGLQRHNLFTLHPISPTLWAVECSKVKGALALNPLRASL